MALWMAHSKDGKMLWDGICCGRESAKEQAEMWMARHEYWGRYNLGKRGEDATEEFRSPPKKCRECGRTFPRIDMHYQGYDMTGRIWLCEQCDDQIHKIEPEM